MANAALIDLIRREAVGIDEPHGLDAVLDDIGRARIVLLGEATHGTHEFYDIRRRISQRLIVEKGYDAIAVEADWPDALSVTRYLHGTQEAQDASQGHSDDDARHALDAFERFPR